MSEANPPPTLRRVFGDPAVARILDFLTLYRVWLILEKYDLVEATRRMGRAEMFKLNTDNPIASAEPASYFSLKAIGEGM